MKEKELTKVESKEIAVATNLESWGDFDGGASELVLPKALLMQGLSDLVTEGKAVIGEYRNSLTGELMAGKDAELELIPFHFERYWAIAEAEGNKFRRIEPITPANENLPWDFTDEDGVDCKRTYTRSFYCLEASDVEGLPVVISFSSTAAKVGKKLWTRMFVMNRQAGKIPCAYSIKVKASITKGDKGTYASPDFTIGSEITNDVAVICRNWMMSIKEGKAKADTSDQTPAEDINTNVNAAGQTLQDF